MVIVLVGPQVAGGFVPAVDAVKWKVAACNLQRVESPESLSHMRVRHVVAATIIYIVDARQPPNAIVVFDIGPRLDPALHRPVRVAGV